MVICSKCKNEVPEAKFCMQCGAPLLVESKPKVVYCTNCGAEVTEKFCTNCGKPINAQDAAPHISSKSKLTTGVEGFLKNIGSEISNKMNNIATSLLTIKSDYKKDRLIYYVEKIPKIKEKRIEINETETALIDFGSGYQKQNTTFTTQDENFELIYFKNDIEISNISIKIPIRIKVNRVQNEDELQVNIEIVTIAKIKNVEEFVKKMINIKKMSWTFADICKVFNDEVNLELLEKLNDIYIKEKGIILKNSLEQIKKYNSDITSIFSKRLSEFFINAITSEFKSIDFDKTEANKIMIKELYR